MTKTFNRGDMVFTQYGALAEYLLDLDGQHLVRLELSSDDEEPFFGDPILVQRVLSSAPREHYDQEIQALEKKIVELTEKKRELENEINQSKANENERKKRIMQNEAIARIDDFMAGKITHVVFGDYDVRIETFDEAMLRIKDGKKQPENIRLLTLFGRSNGNLGWNLAEYYDGSGSRGWVQPCTSLEEARLFAKKRLDEKVNEWRINPKSTYIAHTIVGCSKKYGFEIPDDVAEASKMDTVRSLTERRDKLKIELQEAEVKLASTF